MSKTESIDSFTAALYDGATLCDEALARVDAQEP